MSAGTSAQPRTGFPLSRQGQMFREETLGKRGFIHVESWRLAWDGLQGGFCSNYREYLQENQRSEPKQ